MDPIDPCDNAKIGDGLRLILARVELDLNRGGTMTSWIANGTLTLLTAPPAWGKTSLLLTLIPSLSRTIVFISPLKALALEFCDRLKREGVSVFFVLSKKHLKKNLDQLHQYGVVILSYEHIEQELAFMVEQKRDEFFLVFDEFHLLFKWGDSFRPQLWESFYQMAETASPSLALSATMDEDLLEQIRSSFIHSGFDKIQWVNEGNFVLQKYPEKTYLMANPNEIWIHLAKSLKRKRRSLIFLPYRQQVKKWSEKLHSQNENVLSCVGGETVDFRQRLKSSPNAQVIISTHALSHGVNLPPLDDIFIGHHIDDRDMWFQMVGRGGREGGDYHLYCMNTHSSGDLFEKALARMRNFMAIAFSWQQV